LVGLFFLSLKLPRQWERIARPTALALAPHKSLQVSELSSSSGSRPEVSPPDAFRSIKPADYVARNADVLAGSAPLADNEAPSVVVPVVVPRLPAEVVSAAEPVEETARIEVTVKTPGSTSPDQALLPEPSTAPLPDLPPQVEASDLASAVPERSSAVQVLRDVPASEPGPSLGQELAVPPEPEVRLPRPDTDVVQAPPEQSSEGSDVIRQTRPSVVAPEPNLAADQSPAMVDAVPNSGRPVAPEPTTTTTMGTWCPPPAGENSASGGRQPTLAQPSSIATAEDARPTESAKPAERAEAAAPPAAESAAAGPPTEYIGPTENIGPMKAIGRAWEEPAHLLLQLEKLKKQEVAQAWATEASAAIRKLGPAISVGAPETAEILQHLEQLTGAAPSLATKVGDQALALDLARIALALDRRIPVWKQIGRMGGMAGANAPLPAVDPRGLNKCLSDIDQLTANSSEGRAWRKYLLIEPLHDWAARRRAADERLPRDLAQQVLARLNQMPLTSRQRQFLASDPIAALQREMLRHTAEPVESDRLLQHLENYETSGLPSDARLLARDCQFLAVSSATAQRELGALVEMHYRNNNFRGAVTAELLNRLMPKQEPEYAPVRDTIQGVPVRGQSLMANDITVRMVPDPQRVRLALEINGEVASLTHSTAGPATFYSDNESSYVARKPLEITLRGIVMGATEVAVDNNSQLRGVATDFDPAPIVGRFARNYAREQYDQKAPAADAEVREKIAAKAKERIDRETTQQIAAAEKRLNDELLGPMDALRLDPMMIAAETTEKRISVRLRLAGPDQLGGHTPRPQAPSDSLASVQIHESMLNNMLERLELDGETFDLAGLGKRIAERFHRFQPKPVDPDQEDVKITFAAKDAVHVRCNDGRLEITLAIARLSKGARKWSNFQVRAFYRPVVQGRSVDLAREGVVQLIAPRIGAAAQLPLRGVFSKVFSQKEPIHATPESFVKNPKLEGVVVTQFVIDDGWIGVAIGPQRTVTAQAAKAQR
jgi:hypothetical protein